MTYTTPVRGTDLRLAVSSDGTTFLSVFGVQSYSFSPTITKADNTDLNAGFWGKDEVPVNGRWAGTVSLLRRHNNATYDPAQQIIEGAVVSEIWVRWWQTSFSGAEAKQAKATATWAPGDANADGLLTVAVTFDIKGEPTDIVNPGGGEAPAAWAAETVYQINAQVSLTGGEVLSCIAGGTSDDTTEPAAPGVGVTVTDGTVEWLQISA